MFFAVGRQKRIIIELLMSEERTYASIKRIEKELNNINFPKLLERLVSFSTFLIYDHDPEAATDIVSDYFEKIINLERKWNEAYTFKSACFSGVRSLSDNYNKKLLKKYEKKQAGLETDEVSDKSQQTITEKLEYDELKELALKILKEHDPPPNYLEELIFECWYKGMLKQQEVAKYLGEDIKEIRKGYKRLRGKLGPIQERFYKMGYGKR